MTLPAGARLGPYEILSPLGAGGMGEVYRARDTRLGREIAIKVLPADFATDPERLRRFQTEARAASAISDPHIVAVYDAGNDQKVSWLATELVEGTDLRALMTRELPLKKALDLAAQIASGLAAAHEKGIVHRDLKPENVLVTKGGLAKIADFGLAKLSAHASARESQLPTSDGKETSAGVVMGTFAYMSPEQARGQSLDFRSDQFSFGAILYEMLAGAHPFRRTSGADTLSAILREEPPPLPGSVPAPLRWILERCLHKEPEARYASTKDLAHDLQTIRERLSETASGPAPAVPPPHRRPGVPGRSRAAVAAAALLASGAFLGHLLWRSRAAPPPELRYLTYSGSDAAPAASPDGKTIAFMSSRDGVSRIWIKQVKGGGEAPITSGQDTLPRFTPDGSSVIFLRDAGGRTDLYETSTLGGEPHKLVDDVLFADASPTDGALACIRIVDTKQGGVSSLFVARPDGAEPREIFRSAANVLWFPRFSPDGRWIVVEPSAQVGTPGSFVIVSRDGKTIRRLATGISNASVSGAAWNGDGRSLYYLQAEYAAGGVTGSQADLMQITLDGRVRRLLGSPAMGFVVDVLAPGRFAMDAHSSRENLRSIALGSDAPGARQRWLTRGTSNDRQPVYSPDGEWIAFSSDRGGNMDVWEISRASGALRRLTQDLAEDWDPAFTPDGKHLLWSSNRSGHFEIWIADADGGNPRQVSRDGMDAENPAATPDGRWIIYNSGNVRAPGIWKVRPDGTGAVCLVPGATGTPEVSPDGRYVLYRLNVVSTTVELRVVRISDGSAYPFRVSIPGFRPDPSLGRERWSADGKAIDYIDYDDRRIPTIFAQDFAPGTYGVATRRRLVESNPDAPPESFGLSPDGSEITLANFERLSSLIVADGVVGAVPPLRRTK